jgi:mono/diheme cytochrome c family protein
MTTGSTAKAAVSLGLLALLVMAARLSGDAAGTSAADVARGQYLVGPAGQCSDCHGAALSGGPNPIPGPPGAPWAPSVPTLVGLPMFASDAQAVAFFETGTLPDGSKARPPMPQYRFNEADARAIVAYLRSLTGGF